MRICCSLILTNWYGLSSMGRSDAAPVYLEIAAPGGHCGRFTFEVPHGGDLCPRL